MYCMLIECNENGGRQARYLINSAIEQGDFVLSSGNKTNWYFDALHLRQHFNWFMKILKPQRMPMGILTGGGMMVENSNYTGGLIDIKNETIYLPPNRAKHSQASWISLIDDVVTTEHSLKEAERILNKYGFSVYERLVLLDRRMLEDITLNVKSIADVNSLFVIMNFDNEEENNVNPINKDDLLLERYVYEDDEEKYQSSLLKVGLFYVYD